HNNGSRQIDTTAVIRQKAPHIINGVHTFTQKAVERHKCCVGPGTVGFVFVKVVTGRGQSAHGQTVVTVGEGNDVGATLYHARQLERCLYRVGACWAGKLYFVLQTARGENGIAEFLQKGSLGDGGFVQTMNNALVLQIFNKRV